MAIRTCRDAVCAVNCATKKKIAPKAPRKFVPNHFRVDGGEGGGGRGGQGCIRREGTSEAAPEAVKQAFGGRWCRVEPWVCPWNSVCPTDGTFGGGGGGIPDGDVPQQQHALPHTCAPGRSGAAGRGYHCFKGAKVMRWMGHGPCRLRAATCSPVGYPAGPGPGGAAVTKRRGPHPKRMRGPQEGGGGAGVTSMAGASEGLGSLVCRGGGGQLQTRLAACICPLSHERMEQ